MKDPRTLTTQLLNTQTVSTNNQTGMKDPRTLAVQSSNNTPPIFKTSQEAQNYANQNNINVIGGVSVPKLTTQTSAMRTQIADIRKDHEGLSEKELKDTIDSYNKGTWGANYTLGDMQIKYNKAMSKYFESQDEKDLAEAEEIRNQINKYQKYASNVNRGNIITKDFAGYVPQLLGQTGAGIAGAGAGAVAGATAGAGIGSVIPGAGTAAGAGTGALWGAKAGYVGGVAKFGYDQMRGNAYAGLLDLGVPNDIALKVANDTALWQGIVEGAGAGVDLATLGIGKLFSKGAKTAGQLTAKKMLTDALKAYGINILSEAGEEAVQEAIAIQGEKKATEQAGIQREATRLDDAKRIAEAGIGGGKIALVSGGGNLVGNLSTNTINNIKTNKAQQNVTAPLPQIEQTQSANEVMPPVQQNQNTANVTPNNANVQNVAQKQSNIEQNSQKNVQNVSNLENTAQNDTEKFSQQVEQWKNNNWNPKEDLVVLEHTPKLYQDLGMQDLAITVNPEKLTSIYYPKGRGKKNYHGLEEIVKQIPEALKNPLNIVESNTRDNSIVVITDLADKNGSIITVPISIDDQGNLSIEEFFNGEAVNKMSSAYGRGNYDYNVDKKGNYYDGWMEDNLKNNRIVYDIDEGIIKKRVNGRWLQLPNAVDSLNITNDVPINNIIQPTQNYVNNQENILPSTDQLKARDMKQGEEFSNALNMKNSSTDEQNKTAEILDDTSIKKSNLKELAQDTVNTFKRMFVDSGADIAQIGKIANDEDLYYLYNSAKQAGQSANYMISEAQTNLQGDTVGKSLMDIFEPIRQKGQEYYKNFEYYIYHLHNIDRMNQGKPVFGEDITSEKSKSIANEYEQQYPEFKEYANEIRKWNANLQQYRVDTGLISQEQADLMNEMYPNYVPTYRDVNGISGATTNGNTVRIVNTIKKAKGSDKNILPLHEQMARQLMQTVQAGRRNLVGTQLYIDVLNNSEKLGKYVQEINTTGKETNEEINFDFEKNLEGNFEIYVDGKKIKMQVSDGVLDGLKALSPAKWEKNILSKGAKKVNSTFKKLVTEWNPFFIVKNAVRDIQDAGFYSENAKNFYENYPQAWKEITSNSETWRKYLAMGGSDASLFDFEQGYIIPKDGISNKVIDKIGEANFLVEQAPRFAEFLRIYNNSDKSYSSLMKAMYGAADITVNFGRSGTWGKFINNNLVPFFNPAIQGTSKTIRTILGTDNVTGKRNIAKHMANIVGKGLLLGVAPTMINHILLEVFGGDDYEDISERDKDTYFLFPMGDSKYFKLPKGRVLSVIGGFARRGYEVATGNEKAFDGFMQFVLGQTAPSNPFESNIYSPIQAVKNNTTWYGTPIESESLQNVRPSERYDEGTTELAKWLGGTINYSPKKIDYLIDAYGGAIADSLMPLNTKKAEASGAGKSFTLDSTYSNKLSTEFYDTIEELTFDKNDDDQVANMQLKYMDDVKQKAQDINKQIKDLQASDIEDKEKLKQVRELRKEVNTLQRDALAKYEQYGEVASKYIDDNVFIQYALRGTKEDATEETKQSKIEKTIKAYTDRDMFGAEYALLEYDKEVADKQRKAEEKGIDAETFFKVYFAQKGIESDKNLKGETITNSKSKKQKEAIDKATPELDKWERRKLYEIFNVGKSVW